MNGKSNGKNSKNNHLGHRERMRKRFMVTGLNGYAPHEVLEMILYYAISYKDTKKIAYALLERHGSLGNVFRADIGELMEVEGVGESVAIFLKLMSDLLAYEAREKWTIKKISMANTAMAGAYAIDLFSEMTMERFYIACLDGNMNLIKVELAGVGSSEHVSVNIPYLVRVALMYKATYVVFMHNHPGGSCQPSEEDVEVTEQMIEAFAPLGITVMDHIVVAGKEYMTIAQWVMDRAEGRRRIARKTGETNSGGFKQLT